VYAQFALRVFSLLVVLTSLGLESFLIPFAGLRS
jgi:hypothetical protein